MTSNARTARIDVERAYDSILDTIATAAGEDPYAIFGLIEDIDKLTELRTSLLKSLSLMYDRPAPECVGKARQRLVAEKIAEGTF